MTNPKPAKKPAKKAKTPRGTTSTGPPPASGEKLSQPPTPATPKTTAHHKPLGKKKIVVEIDPGLNKGKRPSPEQMAQRQDAAYRLRLLGKTPEEIAEAWGISPRQIREYLKAARDRQVDELRKLEGRAGVIRQFGVLNHVLEESLAAWEKSKEIKKTKTAGVEVVDGRLGGDRLNGGTKKKSSQREEDQIGDATYLDRAMRASKEIRELLGLDAPAVKRLLVEQDPVKDLDNESLSSLPPEELLRRYRAAVGFGSELVE